MPVGTRFLRLGALVAAAVAVVCIGTVLFTGDGSGAWQQNGSSKWTALLDEYDFPYTSQKPNGMIDSGMGRQFSYSEGDQDVSEYKFMQNKFNRLQGILDTIKNGPVEAPIPPPPAPRAAAPPPGCGEPGGPMCPVAPPPGSPVLSYTARIYKLLRELQMRINQAAKRQYDLEDEVRPFPLFVFRSSCQLMN